MPTRMVQGYTANTMTSCFLPVGCFYWLCCIPLRACKLYFLKQWSPSSSALLLVTTHLGWMGTWRAHKCTIPYKVSRVWRVVGNDWNSVKLTVCLWVACVHMLPGSSAGCSGPLWAPAQGELRLSAGGTSFLKTMTSKRKKYEKHMKETMWILHCDCFCGMWHTTISTKIVYVCWLFFFYLWWKWVLPRSVRWLQPHSQLWCKTGNSHQAAGKPCVHSF